MAANVSELPAELAAAGKIPASRKIPASQKIPASLCCAGMSPSPKGAGARVGSELLPSRDLRRSISCRIPAPGSWDEPGDVEGARPGEILGNDPRADPGGIPLQGQDKEQEL